MIGAHVLHVESETAPALAFALKSAIDNLEARAIIAEHHDTDLGPLSAVEYRSDIPRLARLLEQLVFASRRPHPEGEAVRWLDGLYTIADGRPVKVGPLTPFRRLLAAALQRGHVSGSELAAALAIATGQRFEAIEHTPHRSRTNFGSDVRVTGC